MSSISSFLPCFDNYSFITGLATALATDSSLTKLDLSDNYIKAEGATRLATALASNSTLTMLDLSFNPIHDETSIIKISKLLKINISNVNARTTTLYIIIMKSLDYTLDV